MTPRFVYTSQDFTETVVIGQTTETAVLEFKRDLDAFAAKDPSARRDGQKEAARDIAQFSNASGGCMLLGVDEERRGDARVAVGIRGIDDFDGRKQWIEQAIQNFLVPSSVGVTIARVSTEFGNVVAVNVPANERFVAVHDSQLGVVQYVQRTNLGRRSLHPDEMEELAMNSRRSSALALARVRAALPGVINVDLASGVWTTIQHSSVEPASAARIPAQVRLNRVGDHDFELMVSDKHTQGGGTPVRIPFGLLREVWPTFDDQIGMVLHVRVLHAHGQIALDPF